MSAATTERRTCPLTLELFENCFKGKVGTKNCPFTFERCFQSTNSSVMDFKFEVFQDNRFLKGHISKQRNCKKRLLMNNYSIGLVQLAEAIILQSMDDLWSPDHKEESIVFFKGEVFMLAAEMARIGGVDKLRLLMLTHLIQKLC